MEEDKRLPATIAFINSYRNKYLDEIGIEVGTANGYVAIPFGHPCDGLSIEELEERGISVHGGITYAKRLPVAIALKLQENKCDKNDTVIDVATDINLNMRSDWWLVGFDTCHADDTQESWPIEKVIDETLFLKHQIDAQV